MYFLINPATDQIMGTTNDPNATAGFLAVSGPDAPVENVYFDGEAIQFKPPRPTGNFTWQGDQWVEIPSLGFPAVADWKGLEADFRGSVIYARIYQVASQPSEATIEALIQTQRAATAHSLLLSALSSTRSEADLAFAIAELRTVMAQHPMGDLTTEDVAFINSKLEQRHLTLRLEVQVEIPDPGNG